MLKIENVKIPKEGFEAAIRGMRNPMNSWDKADSYYTYIMDDQTLETAEFQYFVGDSDKDLMLRLNNAPEESKYRRMIIVYLDVVAPLYWWKEFDTYKVGTVANSCSTMHKIHEREFTLDDFSCEHLFVDNSVTVCYVHNDFRIINNKQWLLFTCDLLNAMREAFLKTKDKQYWWQMIQLLPTSYNQRRTVMLNYEVLAQIYRQRKNHRLDEWHTFCDWIETLPHFDIIRVIKDNKN